jgi:hypothetical protein
VVTWQMANELSQVRLARFWSFWIPMLFLSGTGSKFTFLLYA